MPGRAGRSFRAPECSSAPMRPSLSRCCFGLPAAILAAPWALVGPVPGYRSVWRGPLALVITAAPPIGIIGWASPLTSAGVLFPGTRWLGLIATMALAGLGAAFPRTALCVAVIAATAANALHHGEVAP